MPSIQTAWNQDPHQPYDPQRLANALPWQTLIMLDDHTIDQLQYANANQLIWLKHAGRVTPTRITGIRYAEPDKPYTPIHIDTTPTYTSPRVRDDWNQPGAIHEPYDPQRLLNPNNKNSIFRLDDGTTDRISPDYPALIDYDPDADRIRPDTMIWLDTIGPIDHRTITSVWYPTSQHNDPTPKPTPMPDTDQWTLTVDGLTITSRPTAYQPTGNDDDQLILTDTTSIPRANYQPDQDAPVDHMRVHTVTAAPGTYTDGIDVWRYENNQWTRRLDNNTTINERPDIDLILHHRIHPAE